MRPAGRQLLARLNPKITISVVFVLAIFVHGDPGHHDRQRRAADTGHIERCRRLSRQPGSDHPRARGLGDRLGSTPVFLLALVLFTGVSALCGMAHNLPQPVIYRILLSTGGGMLTPALLH
ncbi:MAG: hypothetical protein ACRDRY_24195 [Pseudonocardiaceae bacterium]